MAEYRSPYLPEYETPGRPPYADPAVARQAYLELALAVAEAQQPPPTPPPDELQPPTESMRVTLTPKQAGEWIERFQADFQRPIKTRWAQQLAREMKLGRYRATAIALARLPDGRAILIDGQHRLQAMVLAGIGYGMMVDVHDVPDEEEARHLYTVIDRNDRRGPRVGYAALNLVNKLTLTAHDVERLGAAAAFLRHGFGAWKSCPPLVMHDRSEIAMAWQEEMRELIDVMAEARRRDRILRSGVIAVAIITLRYQQELARTFWGQVAAQDQLVRDAPEQRLYEITTGSRRVRSTDWPRYASACWNAAYDGRTLANLKASDSRMPLVLRGTPLDGREFRVYDLATNSFRVFDIATNVVAPQPEEPDGTH